MTGSEPRSTTCWSAAQLCWCLGYGPSACTRRHQPRLRTSLLLCARWWFEAVEVAARVDESPVGGRRVGRTVGARGHDRLVVWRAHLVRAAGATAAYLDRTPVDAEPEGGLLTAVTYFHAAVDSPIHEQIKQVSENESAVGHQAMATRCADLAAQLGRRLADEPDDRLVGALGGRMLTLDDFCRTRLIEVLLHLDDLAVSVGEPRPETDPLGVAIVIDIVESIARHVHGDWQVLYALARSERCQRQARLPGLLIWSGPLPSSAVQGVLPIARRNAVRGSSAGSCSASENCEVWRSSEGRPFRRDDLDADCQRVGIKHRWYTCGCGDVPRCVRVDR